MGFFKGAHNFIIDGPKDGNQSQPIDPMEVARQAMGQAEAAVSEMHQGSSGLMRGNRRMEITPSMGGGGHQIAINSGSSTFSGLITPMSANEKQELDADLKDMKAKLVARQAAKAQKVANGGRQNRGMESNTTARSTGNDYNMPSRNVGMNGMSYMPPNEYPPHFGMYPSPPPGFSMSNIPPPPPGFVPPNFSYPPQPPGGVPPFMMQGQGGMPNHSFGNVPQPHGPYPPIGSQTSFRTTETSSVADSLTSSDSDTAVEHDDEFDDGQNERKFK